MKRERQLRAREEKKKVQREEEVEKTCLEGGRTKDVENE